MSLLVPIIKGDTKSLVHFKALKVLELEEIGVEINEDTKVVYLFSSQEILVRLYDESCYENLLRV